MAELVELEEVRLHAVVFKMGRDDVAVRVVGRVLHRAEVRDVLVLRHDDKAAGVLAGRALDAYKAERQAVFLGLSGRDPALFEIFFHIAVGSLLGQGADRPRAEDVVRAEEHLGVFVGLGLVLAREVQVDIGGLLVAGVAQESLERDVEAVAAHTRAAVGAVALGHIGAAAVGVVQNEIRAAALGADVVRRQGVDLGDAGHIGHKRRADAASRADQIAVLERVLHKLLGRHVNHVVVMAEDRVELDIDAILHDLRGWVAVDAVHLGIDKVAQDLGRVLDRRREEVLGQQLDLLDLVGDRAGVRDDDLAGNVLPEILKFLQHLVRRPEIDRAAAVGVGKLLGRLQDMAVLFILRVEEVHVRGRDDRLIQLPAEVEDRAVVVLQHALVLYAAVFDEKAVVCDRLDLEIVVKRGDLLQFLLACAVHNRAVELAHAAGRADEDALAVLQQQALRHAGRAVEVFEIGLRDHLVQVFQPHAVLHKEDHMVGLRHIGAAQGVVDMLDIIDRLRALGGQHRDELHHDARAGRRVVRGAVVVEFRQVQIVRHDVELEALEIGAQRLAERERVHKYRLEAHAVAPRAGRHKADVEVGVVGDQRTVAAEVHKHPQRLFLLGRSGDVAVANAGQLGDIGRDRLLGVDKGVELLFDLTAREQHRADLGHAVVHGVETGRLDVEGDKLTVQRQLGVADDGAVAVHVVEVIGLHAVDDLDAVLFPGLPHIREGLGHAVVGHGDRGHAPVGRALDDGGRIGEGVHGRKTGVQVQLHALFLGLVGADRLLPLHDVARLEHHVVVEFIIGDLTLDDQMVAGGDLVDDAAVVLLPQIAGDVNRVRQIGQIEAQHSAALLCGFGVDGDNVALDRDAAGFERQRVHRDALLLDGAAKEHIAVTAARRRSAAFGGQRHRAPYALRVVRHDAYACQGKLRLDAVTQCRDIAWRGHHRKVRADLHGHLTHIHPRVGDIHIIQPAAGIFPGLAAREHF